MRTKSMSSPLISVEGMLDGDSALTIEHVLEHAVVDGEGRLLVSMIDVFAIIRLDADAEVLVMRHRDGASSALRVPEIVNGDNFFLHLQLPERFGVNGEEWTAHVWTPEAAPSASIVSISAMSFASFVGLE